MKIFRLLIFTAYISCTLAYVNNTEIVSYRYKVSTTATDNCDVTHIDYRSIPESVSVDGLVLSVDRGPYLVTFTVEGYD